MGKKKRDVHKDYTRAIESGASIPVTRAYLQSLKHVYHERGLLAAAAYELKSSLYSF